jgi:hypothetical protein
MGLAIGGVEAGDPKGRESLAQALAWLRSNKRDQPCRGRGGCLVGISKSVRFELTVFFPTPLRGLPLKNKTTQSGGRLTGVSFLGPSCHLNSPHGTHGTRGTRGTYELLRSS